MTRSEPRYRTLIVSAARPDQDEWLEKLLATRNIEVVEFVQDGAAAAEAARTHQPTLLIVEREASQAEAIIRQVTAVMPGILSIAMVPEPDVPTLRRLMAVGARDVLPAPASYSELIASIRQTITTEAERRSVEIVAPAQVGRGKLIVVIAPKGGVGATTLAANLALALRQETKQEVALADFSLQFGDVGVHLNLRSKYAINDLLATASEIEATMLKRVLSEHSSGVDVLLAPSEPESSAEVTGPVVEAILDHMLNQYAYVIADTWSFLDEITTTLLRRADEVLLVATPELPTLKNAKRFLEVAGRQSLINGRLSIVLNRFPSIEGITLDDVQRHLSHPVSANIPSEGQLVTHSINRGVPLVVSHPRSWAAQSILRLAGKLAGDDVETITLDANGATASEKPKNKTGGWPWKLSRNTTT